jgi:hypothetical protein
MKKALAGMLLAGTVAGAYAAGTRTGAPIAPAAVSGRNWTITPYGKCEPGKGVRSSVKSESVFRGGRKENCYAVHAEVCSVALSDGQREACTTYIATATQAEVDAYLKNMREVILPAVASRDGFSVVP